MPYGYRYDENGIYQSKFLLTEDPMHPGRYPVPANCTTSEPPAVAMPQVAVWNGESWYVTEDHRQHLDDTGTMAGGTEYWLPSEGDNYQSDPRYMKELGPLPEGAVTTRPEKTAEDLQKEQLQAAINESQNTLRTTDYRVIKFMDKIIESNPDLLAKFNEEYPNTLGERQEARNTINRAQATALAANISL